jgi:hypothetical protein
VFYLRHSSNWNPHRLHSEPFPPKENHNVGLLRFDDDHDHICYRFAQVQIFGGKSNVFKSLQHLPLTSLNPSTLEIPTNVQLADPKFYESGEVDLLLGGGLFWSLLVIMHRSNHLTDGISAAENSLWVYCRRPV